MDTDDIRDVLHRRVRVSVRDGNCCLELLRGGTISDGQMLNFEQVRQLVFELQGSLFEMARIRRSK